jgi:hypothetical protein
MSGKSAEKRHGHGSSPDSPIEQYYPPATSGLTGYPSGSSFAEDITSQYPEIHVRPTGLKGLFYHPYTQVVLLGIVCFMCPGLFNALNGLGAGGQIDSTTSANANSTLYATFAVAAFFAGSVNHLSLPSLANSTCTSSINNVLGPRMTLFLGSFGYAIYIGSYLQASIVLPVLNFADRLLFQRCQHPH